MNYSQKREIVKKIFTPFYKIKYHIKNSHGWFYVGKRTKIVNGNNVNIFSGAQISSDNYLICFKDGYITIGENSVIGRFSRIGAYNEVFIGKSVLTGPNVFIADHNHEYERIDIPICNQGLRVKFNSKVFIDDGCWIGTNSVIVGNVRIGKNSVIAANSVVIHDVPDFSVVAGNPAKIIRYLNQE